MDGIEETLKPGRGPFFAGAWGALGLIALGTYLICDGRDLPSVVATCSNAGLLLVAVLALWFTAAQVDASRRANLLTLNAQRRAAEQAEKDSRAATRPYVYAELVPGLWGASSCDLRVQNFGKTPAKGLVIEVTDWPDERSEHLEQLRRFCETPRTLPPGGSHRLTWFDRRLADDQPSSTMGELVDITIRYGDETGETWSEDYRCDVGMMQVEPAPTEGAEAQGGPTDERMLKNINHALRALNVHVGSLRH